MDQTETELEPGDQLVLQFLHRYVGECSDTGTMLGHSVLVAGEFQA